MEFTLITSGLTQAVSAVGSVWEMVTENPLAVVLIGCAVLSTAIGVFAKFKRSAAN